VLFTMTTGIVKQALSRGAEQVIAKDDLAGLVATLRRLALARAAPRSATVARPDAPGRAGRWARVLVPAIAILYAVSFVPLVGRFGAQTADLAILIVAAAGAAYGLRGGLIAAAAALPVNATLITLAGASAPGMIVTRGAIAIAIGASFGQLRDVTLRARAQARSLADASVALEASDRRLLGIIEGAPVLLVAIDTSGVIVDVLGGGFGDDPKFSPERMRGQQAAVYFADDPNVLGRLSRALSGEEFSTRVEGYGHVYDVHFRARRDGTGGLVGTTVVLVNVGGLTA
jgi:hypothetical protein